MSTSIDGSISFYSIKHNSIIGTVNLEGSIQDVTYNRSFETLMVLVSDSYFYFLTHPVIYPPALKKIEGQETDPEPEINLDFEIHKSFELTQAEIENIFSEGPILYMRDSLGLVHKLDVEEICLRESDLSEEQIKKREKAKKKKLRAMSKLPKF